MRFERLFGIIRELQKTGDRRDLYQPSAGRGCSKIADRVTVLRDGAKVGERRRPRPDTATDDRADGGAGAEG